MQLRRLIFLAMSVTIIFVQEQALMFIPNVQFTVLLIVLFVSVFTLRESLAMIFVYVLLDNLYMGTFNPFYMIPMFTGWAMIPVFYHTILRGTKNEVKLAVFGIFFASIYGFMFVPFNMIQTGIYNPVPYILADLPFQLVMAVSNFFTILWLYQPLYKVVSKELEQLELQFIPLKKNH